jgi:hypothetical protein
MNRICGLPTLILALLVTVSSRVVAQTPPAAAQKAGVAARIAAAELDTADIGPNAAPFPALRKFNHKHKISSDFDRFKNRTTVRAEVISSGFLGVNLNEFTLDALFGFKGKELVAPPRYVLLGFAPHPFPGDWQYLKNHEVNVLVDDTLAIDAGETLWDGEVSNDGHMVQTHEFITIVLPLEQFLHLVNGRKVEFRVGSRAERAVTLKEDQLEVLRDLASRMTVRKSP